MVRVLEEEKEHLKARLGQFKGMFDGIRQTKSLIIDTNGASPADDRLSKSQASSPLPEQKNDQFEQALPPTPPEHSDNAKPPARAADSGTPPPNPQPKGPPSGKDDSYM